MKTRRLQKAYRSTASKLHRKVGDVLRLSTILSGHKLFQEYPCNLVNPDFPNSKCKFDWVILDLKIVIECHGIQHYVLQTFGGDADEAAAIFLRMKKRDEAKKEAALLAGFSYLVVPYWDEKKIDEGYILNLIHMYPEPDCPWVFVSKPSKVEPTAYQILAKERARQHRKQAYAKQKEQTKLIRQEYRRKQKESASNAKVSGHSRNNPPPQDKDSTTENYCRYYCSPRNC